jgi:AcrR family transcriptional regulator
MSSGGDRDGRLGRGASVAADGGAERPLPVATVAPVEQTGPAADVGASATGSGGPGDRSPRRVADRPPRKAATRGEATKTLILQTALRMFRERGFDETTMRAIAKEAGVSVGNAYYYFDSKEHLVQAFYVQQQQEHRAAVAVALRQHADLEGRLRAAMLGWVDVSAPYHAFAGKFFKIAAEPTSPLSPFSRESAPAREASIAMWREVLEGSTAKVDPELARDLPELLWLLHMGTVLYWVHDRSENVERTRLLIERVVPLVVRLIRLSRTRVLRPVTREAIALVRALRG